MQAPQSCTASHNVSGTVFDAGSLSINSYPGDGTVCNVQFEHEGVAEGVGLVHDAANLLGALSLYAELLSLPGVLSDQHRSYAEEIRLLSERSMILIGRLASHTRQSDAQTATVVLPEIVSSIRGLLSKAVGRHLDVSFGVNAFHPVWASREDVERILLNLIKNAAEATAQDGRISVTIEEAAKSHEKGRRVIAMRVRDNGCGMNKDEIERLQESTNVSIEPGRGLGIRIVRELVAKSGGLLEICSHPGSGTEVSVKWLER